MIAFVAVYLTSSCGRSDTTPPETLVGAWNATSVELVSMADPAVYVDSVADLGASVMLVLEADNNFTLTVTHTGDEPGDSWPWGTNSVVTGTWSATDILTLQTAPTSEWQFEIHLNGDSLSLTEADTSFDFSGDDTPEDADLSLDLTRRLSPVRAWHAPSPGLGHFLHRLPTARRLRPYAGQSSMRSRFSPRRTVAAHEHY